MIFPCKLSQMKFSDCYRKFTYVSDQIMPVDVGWLVLYVVIKIS